MAERVPATLVIQTFLDGCILPRGSRVQYHVMDDAIIDDRARGWMDVVDGRCMDRTSSNRVSTWEALEEWMHWQIKAHGAETASEPRVFTAWDGQLPADLWGRCITRVVTIQLLAEGDAAFEDEDSMGTGPDDMEDVARALNEMSLTTNM